MCHYFPPVRHAINCEPCSKDCNKDAILLHYRNQLWTYWLIQNFWVLCCNRLLRITPVLLTFTAGYGVILCVFVFRPDACLVCLLLPLWCHNEPTWQNFMEPHMPWLWLSLRPGHGLWLDVCGGLYCGNNIHKDIIITEHYPYPVKKSPEMGLFVFFLQTLSCCTFHYNVHAFLWQNRFTLPIPVISCKNTGISWLF